jgi:3-oxoacyl-[acyl-carrier protein] reductase
MVVGCDVTKFPDVQAAIGKVYAQFGHVDILVNNAGYGQYILVKDMTEEMWDRMIAVHLKGTFSCTKAVIDKMIAQGSGRIINISSVSGMMGAPTHSHYAAAKAGMIGFTKGLAKELAAHQITVNAVAPGIVETPFIGRMNQDLKEKVIASTLLGRLGRPRDIAAVVAFLATEDAGFITGQVISPNGGLLI